MHRERKKLSERNRARRRASAAAEIWVVADVAAATVVAQALPPASQAGAREEELRPQVSGVQQRAKVKAAEGQQARQLEWLILAEQAVDGQGSRLSG